MTRHTIVARLDSMGDVLISGPAIRAVAAHSTRVTVLAGARGAAAARLLPGVDDVVVWDCPWISAQPPSVQSSDIADVSGRLATLNVEEAVVLTSFHQSALPTALVLRLAGVRRICAISEDYPGSLLDVRVPPPPDGPEPERMLAVVRAAGFELAHGDDGRLAVRQPLLPSAGLPRRPYLVAHPGTAAPARAYAADAWRHVIAALTADGWPVLVTGSADEAPLTAAIADAAQLPGRARDCAGVFDLSALVAVLQRSEAVIAANTGPAHLAAAVGTPVVSLFAPVVPATRWAPYGVEHVLLGDQEAPCRATRAIRCPIPGHPCLTSVRPEEVVAAVAQLTAERRVEVPA
jgi:ADP-heptose:LPS heptosyltransferase